MLNDFNDLLYEIALSNLKNRSESEFSMPLDLGTPVVGVLAELIHFYSRGLKPSNVCGFNLCNHWIDPMNLMALMVVGEHGLTPVWARYKWSWKLNKAVRV